MSGATEFQAVVNIDEVQRLLVEQDTAMAKTLMAVTSAVHNSVDQGMSDAAMAELLQNYEEVLRSCDRFYEASAMVLQEHLNDMRERRQCLTNAIANMAELNGNGEGFLDAKRAEHEVSKVSYIKLVED